jgi:hypothetical protein
MWNAASRLYVAACLLGLSLPLDAAAQAPPDLSGKWTQNNQLTNPVGTIDREYTETIEQQGDVLKVLMRDVSIPTVFIDERSYTTDGQPLTKTIARRGPDGETRARIVLERR